MTCPICGSDEYDAGKRECHACGHYDEDYHKIKQRERRLNDHRARRHRRDRL